MMIPRNVYKRITDENPGDADLYAYEVGHTPKGTVY
jgi:hypothetical protein